MAIGSVSDMRILLVDDNESNRKVAMLMLDRLGYKADAVSSGLEAIQAVCHSHYDLVLMDIVMPVVDGLDATREIRKIGQKGLKIIAITAYVVPGIKEKCLESGMDDCIAKPIRIGDLEAVLKKYRQSRDGL
ncbi:MAG: response regulator [Methanotrichaceae archaeon]